MADTKGNTAVIFTVIGVAAALGITIYLITRKSKAIDQSVVNANAMAGLGQNPIYANTGNVQGSNSNINAQLGIGTTATNPYVAPGQVNTPHGGANTGGMADQAP